jgi:hypothetical protein
VANVSSNIIYISVQVETFAQPAKNCQNGSFGGGISEFLRFLSHRT